MSQPELVQKRLSTSSLQKGKEKGQGPAVPLWNMHSSFLPLGLTGPIASHSCLRLGLSFNTLGLWRGGALKPSEQQHLSSRATGWTSLAFLTKCGSEMSKC